MKNSNPNLHSPSAPPASRYGGVHVKPRTYSQGATGLGRVSSLQRQSHRPDWAEGFSSHKHEYAVTVCERSVGVGGGE